MMFSLSFAVVLLFVFGSNGQTNEIKKGYPFGKLRLAEEGKNEELIPTIDPGIVSLNPDQSSGMQPLHSPCIGSRSLTKLVYPKDKTKYIQCRDEFHYEILTCPNGGEYNGAANSCDLIIPTIDKCEQEKPCLNDGHCVALSNSTFKCTCRQDWTGDRCETPLNSCVKKPCGPNGDCRSLKTADYEQDYVCVCAGRKGYGLNCQETVTNPCLTSSEQFFQFAFSQHAYIQCDGELIYFQPCGPILYWNQEEKICDRKRPAKIELPALLTKLRSNDYPQEIAKEIINEEITITTTVPTEQQNSFIQKGNEASFAFVPARVANRQQLQANMNNQQGLFTQTGREIEQKTQELPSQLSQTVDSNQFRQDFMPKTNQWPNQQFEATIRQPLTIQSGRNQQWSQNTQQQVVPTPMEPLPVVSNIGQSQIRQDDQQQQNFAQQNQPFGTQLWLNQVPEMKTQNNQRFVAQPQSWQGSQTVQHQPRFQDQNQQAFIETTTASQNTFRLQGFQNPREQEPWQTRPITQSTGNQLPQSATFNTQNTQTFLTQPQSWQESQSIQNQRQLTPNIPEGTPINNKNLLSTRLRQHTHFGLGEQTAPNQPSWQNRGTSQNFIQPEASLIDIQRLPLNNENSFASQSVQNQQWTPTFNSESSPDLNNRQLQRGVQSQIRQDNQQQQNFAQQNQAFGTQQRLNQVSDMNTQNNQRFVAQPQSWQGSQTIQNQPQLPSQNQQPFIETTTAGQNVFRLQGFQNSQDQEQSFQTQQTKPQSYQVFAFQPKQWDSPKQDNLLTPQIGLNQQQKNIPIQNSFEVKQPWSNNQQFQTQENQLTGSDDMKIQISQGFATRPVIPSQTPLWPQTGQFIAPSLDTTTVPNKNILSGFSVQSPRGWPSSRIEQRQPDTNQLGSVTTTDQRKPLDSLPTSLSGSWKSRTS